MDKMEAHCVGEVNESALNANLSFSLREKWSCQLEISLEQSSRG